MATWNEQKRLEALEGYGILNSLPEKEYDYIVELASAICNVPVSVINFIGSDKTWFKAKIGLPDEMMGMPRNISFCSHALENNATIQITDMLQDDRFQDNPLVINEPNLRFYAGSPLVSPEGHVLGTLCVLDSQPRELSETQLTAINILAKKVMENLEAKRVAQQNKIERDYLENLLHRVADKAPGAIFKFQITADGKMSFPFISNGIAKIHPGLTAEMLMKEVNFDTINIHPEDKDRIKKSIGEAYREFAPLEEEYRIVTPDNEILWHKATALPEKKQDGSTVWFGTFQDITKMKHYIEKVEHQNQILFEIAWEQSHVVRAPLSRIMALVNTLDSFEMDAVNKELLGYISQSAEELDNIIRGIVQKSEALKTT